jgi:hypothetical protein
MRIQSILLAASAFLLIGAFPATKSAEAQISFHIGIGEPPACPYGYYGYAPYHCAPYGYYGPEWFHGGAFIGAGRWYHGDGHFVGHVNRSFDPRYGYHGGYPEHGGYHEPDDHFHNFHGSHMADPHGRYHGHPHDGHPR